MDGCREQANDMSKELNPKQAKFLANVLGGMKRVDAYKDAYGLEDDDPYIRQHAYQLIATNSYIKAQIDQMNDQRIGRAWERMYEEDDKTLDMYFMIRDQGTVDHNVRLRMCIDYLNRIGVKTADQIEHSGELNVNLLDVMLKRAEKTGDNDG